VRDSRVREQYLRDMSAMASEMRDQVGRGALSPQQRPDPKVVALARTLGKIGRRVYLVSVAAAAYEVWEADDKSREVVRQGVIRVAGPIGGVAGGAAVVATGVCAATAPVCVGLAALVGGLLFSFGSDWAFGSIYPAPGSR
jgi:hypothetical protein